VHDVHARLVDELVGERALLGGDVVSPVATPVDRDDHDVSCAAHRLDPLSDAPYGGSGEVVQQVHACPVGSRGPGDSISRKGIDRHLAL
jgi:hypothetical protein